MLDGGRGSSRVALWALCPDTPCQHPSVSKCLNSLVFVSLHVFFYFCFILCVSTLLSKVCLAPALTEAPVYPID